MKKTCVFYIILTILLCSSAAALQINLGSDNKIFFQPNLQKEITMIISKAERPATVPITLGGSMAQYAKLDTTSIELSPGETKEVKITIQLPEDIPKGVHTIEVSAKEVPKNQQEGAFIWIPAVGMTIKIINTDVLQDCSLQTLNFAMSPTSISMTMNAANTGLNPVSGIYAKLTLYDKEGMPITDWTTGSITAMPFESKTLQETHSWQEPQKPGYYSVKGTLYCGEKTIPIDAGVLNGANTLKVNEFRAFKKDGKLYTEFDLENENEAPVSALAHTQILDGDKVLDKYDMTGTTVPPLGKNTLSFWAPITGLYIPIGTFKVKTTLAIQGGTREEYIKEITFTEEDVSKKKSGGGFGVATPKEEEETEQQVILEKPSSEGISKKGLVRIIAGLLILVILTLIILKVLSKKNQ